MPLLIGDPPGGGNLPPLAATNKYLAQSNKSFMGRKATKKRVAFVGTGPLVSIRPRQAETSK